MRHFILFLSAIFLMVFLAVLNRQGEMNQAGSKPIVRVFSYASFAGSWGPGPRLKEIFEKTCDCRVEFIEGSDSGILLQRLKIEGASLGADLVIGFDQFDLQKALGNQSWQKIDFSSLDLEPEIKTMIKNDYFIPYDWGVLSFMGRNDSPTTPSSLDDLLDPKLRGRLALQDPRTSSPGLLFMWWVVKSKGENEGFQFLSKLAGQVHSYSPSWSTSLGLYNKNQADLVFSYVTSPIYYQVEEKNSQHRVFEFREPAPLQVEFAGIPDFCRQCDLAERFVNLMLSAEGQRIIMEKNYMSPVLRGVREGTAFANAGATMKTLKFEIPSESEVDHLLKRWTEMRRGGSAL